MEKNCINCKWYYNQKCNNANLSISKEDNTYWNVTKYIEDGILAEQIRENIDLNKLGNDFIATIESLGYIKKNCINKALNEKYEDDEAEIYESIEFLFSKMLTNYFKNNGQTKTNITISNPETFYCCNWE